MRGEPGQRPNIVRSTIAPNVRGFLASRQPLLWLAALVIGVAVGGGAILFRLGINAAQLAWLGTMSEKVASVARIVPWYYVLLAPAAGGLVVGLILTRFIRGGRPFAIADVIEARELGPQRIDIKEGLWSALVSALSLGSGASAGREGPVVHLGATLAVAAARMLKLHDAPERTLLACGVAGAVAASFNAPIAGVLFAHEVILGHYALSAFVPIVMASAGASILSRLWFGEDAAFVIPDYHVFSYLEVPAFALLGVTCAIVAVLFQVQLDGRREPRAPHHLAAVAEAGRRRAGGRRHRRVLSRYSRRRLRDHRLRPEGRAAALAPADADPLEERRNLRLARLAFRRGHLLAHPLSRRADRQRLRHHRDAESSPTSPRASGSTPSSAWGPSPAPCSARRSPPPSSCSS